MKKNNKQGIIVNGSVRSAGVTFYTKQGRTIVRSSKSMQPKRCTELQFKQRERYSHSISLWFALSSVSQPLMPSGRRPYDSFRSLAAKLPAVYLTQRENASGIALLMPGIPVSCGTLTDIGYSLGEVETSPALLTDLQAADLGRDDSLLLVTLRQIVGHSVLRLEVRQRVVTTADFTVVEGRLALVDNMFADTSRGWALVRRRGDSCSSQTVVTAATLYRDYQTHEALLRAAESYGGLTG